MCRIVLNYVLRGCVCVEMCSVMLYCAGVVCYVLFIAACIVVYMYVCLYVVELCVRVCVSSQGSHIGISCSLVQLISTLGGYLLPQLIFICRWHEAHPIWVHSEL